MIRQQLLILPVMLPLIGAIPAAFLRPRHGAWAALLTSFLTLVVSALVLATTYSYGPQAYRIGGWDAPYGIVLISDIFSAILALTTAVIAFTSSVYTLTSGERIVTRRLYHPLFLLLLAALGGVFLTGDLFNLYVFMEMVILSSFALVAMADKPVSAETTFKYAVLSAIGSLLLLTGIAFVYASFATLNMADIAERLERFPQAPFWNIAGGMILFAFLLKGAVFPFHFWQPDAHSAAPSPVSAMLSGILVKVGFYGIARMTTLIFPDTAVVLLIAPLGAVSCIFGGLAALANNNLKRILAYSTIANMGFILLAIGWGGHAGLLAATVNAVNHALIKASLFLSGGYISERLHEQNISRMGGLAKLTASGTLIFGIGTAALIGLPPLSGFLSKLTLFGAGLAEGDTATLTVAVLASALGIAYNLRMFTLVFWGGLKPETEDQWRDADSARGTPAAALVLVMLYIFLGLWPNSLMSLAAGASEQLNRPQTYIDAVFGRTK